MTAEYLGIWGGRADQVRYGRAAVSVYLEEYPAGVREDAVLIVSELFSNAVVHSRSRHEDGSVILRAAKHDGCVVVSVADDGGSWDADAKDYTHPHGLDIVERLVGPGNWGVEPTARGRRVWARLEVKAADGSE